MIGVIAMPPAGSIRYHSPMDATAQILYSGRSLLRSVLGQCHLKLAVRPRRTSLNLPPSLLTAAEAIASVVRVYKSLRIA